MNYVYLTRRNLRTLLNKLDRENSLHTIIKYDTQHPVYPCSAPTTVIAVEDEDYYFDRLPGWVSDEDLK